MNLNILTAIVLVSAFLAGCSSADIREYDELLKQSQVIDHQTMVDEPPVLDDEAESNTDLFAPIFRKWLGGENIDGVSFDLISADPLLPKSSRAAVAYAIDTNGDGKNELAIKTGCATVGNCDLLIYKRNGDEIELILSDNMIQRFEVLKDKQNGYSDIGAYSHGSSTSGGYYIFRFNGNKYNVSKCFEYQYSEHQDKPTLEKRECWKDGERIY